MIWLLVSVAGAQDLPDRLALTLEEGTSIGGIAAHEGEEWLAWLEEGSQQVRVLDGQTWEVTAVSVCTDHGGEAAGLSRIVRQCGEFTVSPGSQLAGLNRR